MTSRKFKRYSCIRRFFGVTSHKNCSPDTMYSKKRISYFIRTTCTNCGKILSDINWRQPTKKERIFYVF